MTALPLAGATPLEPAPELSRLREETPVAAVTAASGDPAWLVTRHEDARVVLGDHRFGIALPGMPAGAGTGESDSLLQDPPGHTRLRRLVASAFTARRIADLRPRIAAIATGLVDDIAARTGPVDLVAELAHPLPITVIGELLGVPAAERERFRAWSDTLLGLTGAEPGAGWPELWAQVDDMVARKRADPGPDLLSALITASDDDAGRLSHAELVTMAITLVTAGYVTTSTTIATATMLLTPGGELARLRDVPAAVEEVLRYPAVVGDAARVATEDLRLGGVDVAAGEKIVVSLAAANRDPRRFADPDRFDPTRADNPHLTFGHGVHRCLGAALARLELQVVVAVLAERLPGLCLAVPADEVAWHRSALFGDQWPAALPVCW